MPIYFSDIPVEAEYSSVGRTVTEADIVLYAGISGDHNPLHTDEKWVLENTDFKSRIAHGLLTLSIGEGLSCQEVDNWQILAFLEVQRKMVGAVYPGDRIYQHVKVTSKRPSSSKPDRGIVTLDVEVRNQEEVAVQLGSNILLIGEKI